MNTPKHVAPNEGENLSLNQDLLTIKLDAKQTGGQFSIIERTVAPLFTSPPQFHSHPDLDWACYVLEGQLEFYVEEKTYLCPKGAIVYVPRDVYFRWGNPSQQQSKALFIYSPGGFEGFFREIITHLKGNSISSIDQYPRSLDSILKIQDKYKMKRK